MTSETGTNPESANAPETTLVTPSGGGKKDRARPRLYGPHKNITRPSPTPQVHTTSNDIVPEADPWLQEPAEATQTEWITPGKKKRPHVDVCAAEESDSRVKESVHEIIKKRGEILTEETSSKLTSVKVEFKIKNNTTQFNVRTALGKLLEQMKMADKEVILQSNNSASQWNNAEELPTGDDLMQHITVRHENSPVHNNSVTVYVRVQSAKTIGEIKFHHSMYHYLSANKIFLRPDRYKTEKTRSPGFFIKLHPRLIYKDTFKAKLVEAISNLKVDKTQPVIKTYLTTINHNEEGLAVPDFHLHSTKRKFGPVTAEVLSITCAEDAATYLKTVLCKLSEKKAIPQGIFIPTGTQQILGPATMVRLLRQHNLYIATTTMVAIEGIDEEVMWDSEIYISPTKTGNLEDKLKHDIPGIHSVEKTNSTNTTGKWFIVLTKQDESKLQEYIDTNLPAIFSQIKVLGMEMDLDAPKRSGASQSTVVVGSYAAVLKGLARQLAPATQHKYDSSTLRPRKRPTVNVSNAKENHPPETTEWPSIGPASQSTEANNMVQTMEQKIEQRFSQQITDLKTQVETLAAAKSDSTSISTESMEQKFAQLQHELEEKLNNKVNIITKQLQDQIITKMTTSFTSLTQVFEKKLESSMETMLHSIQSTITAQGQQPALMLRTQASTPPTQN